MVCAFGFDGEEVLPLAGIGFQVEEFVVSVAVEDEFVRTVVQRLVMSVVGFRGRWINFGEDRTLRRGKGIRALDAVPRLETDSVQDKRKEIGWLDIVVITLGRHFAAWILDEERDVKKRLV